MIINFSIKNYRSFRNTADLTMEANDMRGSSEIAIAQTLSCRNILPVAGIFGANASGKTNIIKALDFCLQAIRGVGPQEGVAFHELFSSFALDRNNEPVEFSLEILSAPKRREYEMTFAVQNGQVISENLNVMEKVNRNCIRRTVYRVENGKITFGNLAKKELDQLKTVLEYDRSTLLISRLARLVRYPIAKDFLAELDRIVLTGSYGIGIDHIKLIEDADLRHRVVNFVAAADTNILDISVKKADVPDEVKERLINDPNLPDTFKKEIEAGRLFVTRSTHKGYAPSNNVELDFSSCESNGTQKLFALGAMIIDVLDNGKVLILDELDSSLHPYLSAKIVETFQDKNINKNGAQLIFTSHEDYLMSKAVSLRTDEIYFVEKNKKEQSELYSLADFNIRNDAAIDRKYLDGRLGAVPVLASGGFDVYA